MKDSPDNPDVLRRRARALRKQRAHADAVRILERALELEPRHADVLNDLAELHALLRQPEQAQAYLDRLLVVMPDSSQVHLNAARNALAMNRADLAKQLGLKAVDLSPANPDARMTLADALEAEGEFEQAKDHYLAVLAQDPGNASAFSKLLSLRNCEVPERHEREAQQLLLGNDLSDAQRTELHFGLAQYYDIRGQYDQAFRHISAANAARHGWYPFDSDRFSSVVDDLTRVFSKESLGAVPVPDVRSSRPVFIVGMPRSGTTLVEQVLASHSRIAGGGELVTLTNIATEIARAPGGYPRGLFSLDAGTLGRHARHYLDKLASISAEALRVTDKMPFNFLHLGLAAALFPGARVIHCRRDPRDTCTSCHFTPFNRHLQFASDLRTLGRYYLDYRHLMEHWQAVLTIPLLEIDYESLVNDTEPTIRRLVEFCGVDWEPGCTRFHETGRGILTPSRSQVRLPIYRHAIGRWRHYEKHLAPLLGILAPALPSPARR